MSLHRRNLGFIGNWWWTIDRFQLSIVGIIMAFSAVIVATASPAVAERIGLESFYFVKRQLVYLMLAISLIGIISMMPRKMLMIMSSLGFLMCLGLLVMVLFFGTEVKGAKRWIALAGFSLQPSEFIKPFFAIISAYILSRKQILQRFSGIQVASFLYGFIVCLLVLQPDLGQIVMISAVWGGQLFLAGLSYLWIVLCLILGVVGLVLAYFYLPHVTQRINNFLDPTGNENYQVKKSIEAYLSGGLYGKGPGEGTVKQVLPDSHTDFVFAVIGEELGAIACVIIILLYAAIIMRGFIRLLGETDLFTIYAVGGLLMQFGLQSIINMAVTMNLMPTKGITLPFISYGGSSMLAVSMAFGMMLALSRKKYGAVSFNIKKDLEFI